MPRAGTRPLVGASRLGVSLGIWATDPRVPSGQQSGPPPDQSRVYDVPPVSTRFLYFRPVITGSLSARLRKTNLTDSCPASSATLTTTSAALTNTATGRSGLRWFATTSCKPMARDLPHLLRHRPRHADARRIKGLHQGTHLAGPHPNRAHIWLRRNMRQRPSNAGSHGFGPLPHRARS